MSANEVVITAAARQDLLEITAYIASDNAAAALDMHDKLIARMQGLVDAPESGAIMPDLTALTHCEIRRVMVKPYSIYYAFFVPAIVVYRVVHQKRDMELNNVLLGFVLRNEWKH